MEVNGDRDPTAAAWRAHRLALEDWRSAFLDYLAASRSDSAELRNTLLARVGAADDAIAAAVGRTDGTGAGGRPQSLAVFLRAIDRMAPGARAQMLEVHFGDQPDRVSSGTVDVRQHAGDMVLRHLESRIRQLETAEQSAEGA
jgi:hypothetical protein